MAPFSAPPTFIGALSLREVRQLLRELSPEEFTHQYGATFLIYHPAHGEPPSSGRLSRTLVLEDPVADEPAPSTDVLIFPVRPSGRSPFPNFISVGRANNNDIVIPEPSLSKFHAFFRIGDGGRFTLTDAGSQNGTFVDEARAPSKDKGAPLEVKHGSSVRFGAAVCAVVNFDGLRAVARAIHLG